MPELNIYDDSTLTDRYQTTIPNMVRKALGLKKRDKIRYTIQAGGKVLISRVEQDEDDPVLERFLTFLSDDIDKNPRHVKTVNAELPGRIQSLVSDVEIDLDSPLPDEDD